MSMSTHPLPLGYAEKLASELVEALRPGCVRIEIAGSIRRHKMLVNDLEIVAIPAYTLDLFGDTAYSQLDPVLRALMADGTVTAIKGGRRYMQFHVPAGPCKLDLFLCRAATWGVIFTQRTGSARFSHQLVTPQSWRTSDGRPGLLPDGLRVRGAKLRRADGTVIPTPEERDLFDAIGLKWVEPWNRH